MASYVPQRESGQLDHTFQGQRHAHAATDAQSRNAALGVALEHLMQQRDRDARACASDGMPQRDCSSIYVELVAIEIEHAIAGQYLRGKRLIQFNQPEIVQPQVVLVFEFL